jgi:hypothetical protein
MKTARIGTFLFAGALAISGAGTLHAATMTLEGTVSDAMCGAKHPVADAAGCTKDCVKKGSDYALIVGSKVYTLKASSEKDKADLGKLAGKMAKVTGDVTGENVIVTSVTMGTAKK